MKHAVPHLRKLTNPDTLIKAPNEEIAKVKLLLLALRQNMEGNCGLSVVHKGSSENMALVET